MTRHIYREYVFSLVNLKSKLMIRNSLAPKNDFSAS